MFSRLIYDFLVIVCLNFHHTTLYGTLYWDYSEKIHFEGCGLLYKSEASMQIPKPGRSLENIKCLQGRCKQQKSPWDNRGRWQVIKSNNINGCQFPLARQTWCFAKCLRWRDRLKTEVMTWVIFMKIMCAEWAKELKIESSIARYIEINAIRSN